MLRSIYLAPLIASALGALHHPLRILQATTTATTSAQSPSQSLAEHITKLCYPNIHIWQYGTAAQKQAAGFTQYADIQAFIHSLANSPFPCESSTSLYNLCTTENIPLEDITRDIIESERACLCPSAYWEHSDACLNCQRVHGYPEEWIAESKTVYDALKAVFCNETLPEMGLYGVEIELAHLLPTLPSTGSPDQFPGRTDVSLYYTEAETRVTASSGMATGTVDQTSKSSQAMNGFTSGTATGTGDLVSSSSQLVSAFTSGGGGGGGGGGGLPSPTISAGAAPEVKTRGRTLMAILGAIFML